MPNNFAVYSKPGCRYCEKIKTVLESKKYNYREYVLDRDFNAKQFKDQFGEASFPRVILNDIVLGGATETVQYLQSKGMI